MFPDINDYYRHALEELKKEIACTSESQVLGMQFSEWVSYLVRKYGMTPIVAHHEGARLIELSKGNVLVVVPVESSDTFDAIKASTLTGTMQWMGFDYRTFYNERYSDSLVQSASSADQVKQGQTRIREYVQSLNSAIDQANQSFPDRVNELAQARVSSIQDKNKKLDAMAEAVGIPLVRRNEGVNLVPTAIKPRQAIVPILPPPSKPPSRPVLESEKLNAIMEIIDNQCRQFERTPTVFQAMPEEALRDVMLSSLNGVFEGAAGGEVFRGLGKSDIHLHISKGEVFVAELKIWGGSSSLAQAVEQLLDRLTWRDAHGVIIMFSKNTDFGGVLESIEASLPALPGAIANSTKPEAAGGWSAKFTLPSDASSRVEIHVRAYNLYTPRASGRTS